MRISCRLLESISARWWSSIRWSIPGVAERLVQLGPVPMDPERSFPEEMQTLPVTAFGAYDDQVREIRAARERGLHEREPETYCELEWSLFRRGLVGDPEKAEGVAGSCHLPNEWPTRLAVHLQHHFLGSMLQSVTTPLEVASLEVPVLTIHGTRDRNAPYGAGREWAASLPGARLLTVPGAGHALHHELDIVAVLDEFLGGEWPRGSERIQPGQDPRRSQLQAWDLLVEAHERLVLDGTNLDATATKGTFASEWRGEVYPRSQSRTSSSPFEPAFPTTWSQRIGADLDTLVYDESMEQTNFTGRYRSVVSPDDAFDRWTSIRES